MEEALKEARKAKEKGEVPVGAVIVKDGEIIARAHNLKEERKSALCHAEILVIEEATKVIGDWRLNGCIMYVTLEPCPMCAGAILQSRISEINIGTFDPTAGACGSVINVIENPYLNSSIKVNWIYSDECSEILTEFFKARREESRRKL
ncbi:MAG: nucleoside deaminase [Clostridium cadaveris]|nr:nucleoside deaminase [Clostridium cadaveris]MDU4952988.1 nucleoside deaminase [Clostridium sp.]MDM8312305.1 nucleoside deaminase [Clostridium cadaveris]MDY4950006.1 nucleoside deaminase [Clostridium cadaveris]NME64555.1 nucleoside deaminase [Clostridium cadaveris]NWK12465.1 nucleoside deaminase [Clostridium cadaveris]